MCDVIHLTSSRDMGKIRKEDEILIKAEKRVSKETLKEVLIKKIMENRTPFQICAIVII